MDANHFTLRAIKALSLAREAAKHFKQNGIGTEHLLLSIIRMEQEVYSKDLKRLGFNLKTIYSEIEKKSPPESEEKIPKKLLYTPRVSKVLSFAKKEAEELGQNIGTWHLLLGLLDESGGKAMQILKKLEIDIPNTRHEILAGLKIPRRHPHEKIASLGESTMVR